MGKSKKHAKSAAPAAAETFDYSVGDPAFAEWLRSTGFQPTDLTESSALGITALYRAVALIAGTIASLPLKVYRDLGDGQRERVPHFLDRNPAGPMDLPAFNWVETLMLHQLLHGEAFLKHITTNGGELVGLWPVHPLAIKSVKWDGPDKAFEIAMSNGSTETAYSGDLTQVIGISSDGLRGMSPLTLFRRSLRTVQAGEVAANRSFTQGALIAGLVTSETDIDETEAKAIKAGLDSKMNGAENAGGIAFVNRSLKFTPWSLSAVDAQFLESRMFGVEDVARIFGLPINLLSVNGAVSNWGTGVAEANLGLQKYVLMPHTSRVESALSAILPPDHVAEFDYAGLLQGSPKDEIELLIEQVKAGLLTKDEARAIRNLPPLTSEQKADQKPPDPVAPAAAPPPPKSTKPGVPA